MIRNDEQLRVTVAQLDHVTMAYSAEILRMLIMKYDTEIEIDPIMQKAILDGHRSIIAELHQEIEVYMNAKFEAMKG